MALAESTRADQQVLSDSRFADQILRSARQFEYDIAASQPQSLQGKTPTKVVQ
jgi:hypothetical protein